MLQEDVTIAGPISPKLFVSTSGTDSDWDVKVIDVYPPDYPDSKFDAPRPERKRQAEDGRAAAHFYHGWIQQLVRGEPFRGSSATVRKAGGVYAGKVEEINFNMQDVNHTFGAGTESWFQVQSWFPLTDRNPQTFVKHSGRQTCRF